ncbi:MAG: GTP 3',8-cyclase MoaA, partial [Planctomycetota bacterium]|nr:GTP 3',8-cyclase MoaA [Planctomycetota bacterium]
MSLPAPIQDLAGRALRNLRLSVTDRCNLRCHYCMPEREYTWLPRKDRLSFEELTAITGAMIPLGVRQVRLTGGEPLLRRGIEELITQLYALPGLEDVALTTNGVLLAEQAQELRSAGLRRITVSLDTLKPKRFEDTTRQDLLPRVLDGLAAASAAGFDQIKLNTVLLRGSNDDELEDLLAYALDRNFELRFIEYMDVGGAQNWRQDHVVSKDQILDRIRKRFGELAPLETPDYVPARRWSLKSGGSFGIVASTTSPFCGTCNRARITADGRLFTCLYGTEGMDLRSLVREPGGAANVIEAITDLWTRRKDRGAEERLSAEDRGAFQHVDDLKQNP